jgi:hypothetical protein
VDAGLNQNRFNRGKNFELPVHEYAVARLLAGLPCDPDLTDGQAEDVANWIGSVWHVAPVAIPLFLGRFGDQVSESTVKRLTAISAAAALQGKAFREVTSDVARIFANRNIDLVALKGTANGFMAYPDPEHRTGADLDFCVRPDKLDDSKDALKAIGFWAGDYDPEDQVFLPSDKAEREHQEDKHYALGFWVKMLDLGEVSPEAADGFALAGELLPFASQVDGRHVKTPVLVDIHHAIGSGVSAEDIMDRPIEHVWNGTKICLPPREWAAFHALLKLYWEGGQSYRKGFQYLADLARILTTMSEDEQDMLVSLIEGYNLGAGGYYVLRRLPACMDIDLSGAVHDALDGWASAPPGETPQSYNDLGDFWPRLFGRL